jgi:hypothetical protein
VWLELAHPELPSCGECRRYWYGEDFTCPTLPGDSTDPADRIERPAGSATPCHACPKIPPGEYPAPHNATELSDRNRRCWEHYQECRAVLWRVPDVRDPLVRWHAALLDEVERLAERQAARRDAGGVLIQLGRILKRGDRGR